MRNTKLAQLQQATKLTRLMQKNANDALWENLPGIEKKRQSILNNIFPISEVESSIEMRSELEKLITLNAQLENQCKQKKQDLQIELKGLNNNKKAVNAYQTT